MTTAAHDAELGDMSWGIPDEFTEKDMLVRVHGAADRVSSTYGTATSVRIDLLVFDENGPSEHRNICEKRKYVAGPLAERYRLGLPYLACRYTVKPTKAGSLVGILQPLPQETYAEREIVASLRRAAISSGWDLANAPS